MNVPMLEEWKTIMSRHGNPSGDQSELDRIVSGIRDQADRLVSRGILAEQNREDLARGSDVNSLFVNRWVRCGSPSFRLSHSSAALLAATKAQAIDWDHLPFEALVLEVPREFAPVNFSDDGYDDSGCRVFIALCHTILRRDKHTDHPRWIMGIMTDTAPGAWASPGLKLSSEFSDDSDEHGHGARICARLASNAINYINSYSENVRAPGRGTLSTIEPRPGNYLVTEPAGITVDRRFRHMVRNLVSQRTFAGAKRALAHVVRGHWRNQAVGEGRQQRKMTWVRPHMRGDESLGRVVERIERISGVR